MATPTLDETIAELKLAGQPRAEKTAAAATLEAPSGNGLLRKVAALLRESQGERLTWDDFHGVKTAAVAQPNPGAGPLREVAAGLRKHAAEQSERAMVKTAKVLAGVNALTLLENGLTR